MIPHMVPVPYTTATVEAEPMAATTWMVAAVRIKREMVKKKVISKMVLVVY